MRTITLAAVVIATIAAGCAQPPPRQSPPAVAVRDRPNIVFVFADDHAAHAISAYGSLRSEAATIMEPGDFTWWTMPAVTRVTSVTGR